ncbi:kelch 40a [Paramuricea clavata]|uniref:Kelch 40a n=1 Tax=Paramuricea clavata TaxID=317549 RepID=A0A7D9IHS8_PARCT|nr:kelch 40a [Paramuricea clavata]
MAGETKPSSAERNSFTLPWNDSDVILVVQGWELHVHKTILALQSPVFKAMFNGQFREATAERVTLEGKTHKWVLQFLRLLYPANMIRDGKVKISDENVFEILKLADEYQADNVVSQCLAEVNLTNENVLRLLPYAVRHDQSALSRLNEKIGSGISVEKLGKFVPELSDSKAAHEIFVSKGCHLEKAMLKCCRIIEQLLCFIGKRKAAISRNCGHTVKLSEYENAVKCKECVSIYRKMFIDEAANQIVADIQHVQLREMRAKSIGDSIIQVLNMKANTKSGNGI